MSTERALALGEKLLKMVDFYSNPSLQQIKDFFEQEPRYGVSATIVQDRLIFCKIGRVTHSDKKLLTAYKKKERAIKKAKSEYAEAEAVHSQNSEHVKPFAVLLRIKDLSDQFFRKTSAKLKGYEVVYRKEKTKGRRETASSEEEVKEHPSTPSSSNLAKNFCTSCGRKIETESNYCGGCGVPLKE